VVHTLDNIERTRDPADLHRAIATGRPILCAELFAEVLPAHDDAIRAFGDGVITTPGEAGTTVAEYFTRAPQIRGSVNVSLPHDLGAQLVERARCTAIARDRLDLVVWMGRRGCLQRFHCDMDCHDNFLAQAFGTKRVCLVSPAHTQKLQPSFDRQLLFSELPFHLYSEHDKLQLLRFADGHDCLLQPGETLYIPPLWWHYVDYVSDSISISWRTAHTPLLDELGVAWPRLWKSEWPLWQGIVCTLAANEQLAGRHGDRARTLVARLGSDADAHRALRELHDELCPDRYRHPFGVADLAVFEVPDRRPPPPKTEPWSSRDVPQLRPFVRFATTPRAILVIDGKRVAAEMELDEPTYRLLDGIDGHRDVAALAERAGWAVDDACSVIDQLASEGWVTTAVR
jgi:hypothetical protein